MLYFRSIFLPFYLVCGCLLIFVALFPLSLQYEWLYLLIIMPRSIGFSCHCIDSQIMRDSSFLLTFHKGPNLRPQFFPLGIFLINKPASPTTLDLPPSFRLTSVQRFTATYCWTHRILSKRSCKTIMRCTVRFAMPVELYRCSCSSQHLIVYNNHSS